MELDGLGDVGDSEETDSQIWVGRTIEGRQPQAYSPETKHGIRRDGVFCLVLYRIKMFRARR